MSKTAEEILHEHMSGKDIDELPNAGVSAMREFAAQKVEAYKKRVFKAVALMERSSLSEIVDARDEGYAEAVSDAMRLIDTVK